MCGYLLSYIRRSVGEDSPEVYIIDDLEEDEDPLVIDRQGLQHIQLLYTVMALLFRG